MEDANQKFLAMLPPELAQKANVPLPAPAMSATTPAAPTSFPFSPAVFPEPERGAGWRQDGGESQSMEVDTQSQLL